jgi:hypothetical protein
MPPDVSCYKCSVTQVNCGGLYNLNCEEDILARRNDIFNKGGVASVQSMQVTMKVYIVICEFEVKRIIGFSNSIAVIS